MLHKEMALVASKMASMVSKMALMCTKAHHDTCAGMAANMIGCSKDIIIFLKIMRCFGDGSEH